MPESTARFAALFRACLVGFEGCTAEDVEAMTVNTPSLLEYVILEASDVLGGDDEDEVEDDEPEFEDSIFAAHQKSAGEQKAEEFAEADMVHLLHARFGYRFDEVYRLLIGEIDLLLEGAEKAEERAPDRDEQLEGEQPQAAGQGFGNKGDRAAQLGWR